MKIPDFWPDEHKEALDETVEVSNELLTELYQLLTPFLHRLSKATMLGCLEIVKHDILTSRSDDR